jgi:hypothetical protein
VFNDRYEAISTNCGYCTPASQPSVKRQNRCVREWKAFQILDRLRSTATGLDAMPAWFLRVAAPIFAATLAQVFNQSLVEGIVPNQWITAVITQIPELSKPAQPGDFRPVSVTSVLSRSLQRCIVCRYIYPALQQPPQV